LALQDRSDFIAHAISWIYTTLSHPIKGYKLGDMI